MMLKSQIMKLQTYKMYEGEDTVYVGRDDVLKILEQQPKTGHWIRVDDTKLRCSECDVIHFIAMYPSGEINFCPNCGADMRESEDETPRNNLEITSQELKHSDTN